MLQNRPAGAPLPPSVFDATLERARSGDSASQNLLGFMLFYGQGAMPDPTSARFWFGVGAQGGDARAQLNLAVMHALGAGTEQDDSAAVRYFRMAMANPGRPRDLSPVSLERLVEVACDPRGAEPTEESQVFGTFCAGCHGVAGIAEYRAAPSFAFGERMEKSDADLLRSVEEGHQEMPQWSDKLPRVWLTAALRHARGLSREFRFGVLHRIRPLPERAFRFGAMDPEMAPQRREPAVGVEAPSASFDELCDNRMGLPGG